MLYNATLTFSRTAEGTNVNGFIGAGDVTTYNATGNLQPAGKTEMDIVEDGYRGHSLKLFITKTVIQNDDEVTINGVKYFAKIKEDFTDNLSIGHCEIILISETNENAV